MMLRKKNRFIRLLKPFSVMLILFLTFAIVWVRSSYVSLEYNIRDLEKKKAELMRSGKLIAAEKTSLISAERFGKIAAEGFTFPDRIRVVHVKSIKDGDSYKASFKEHSNANIIRK
jgi:hypothetical protein